MSVYECAYCIGAIYSSADAQERSQVRWRRANADRIAKVSGLSLERYVEHLRDDCPYRVRAAASSRPPPPVVKRRKNK